MSAHFLTVVCPNCNHLLSVPVRIGQVHCNPKSLYLVNLSASVKHTCRTPGDEAVLEDDELVDAQIVEADE